MHKYKRNQAEPRYSYQTDNILAQTIQEHISWNWPSSRYSILLFSALLFWLDFQGLRLPRITKNPKKGLLEKHRFLGFKKVGSKAVFLDFLMFLAPFWSSGATQNHRINFQFMCLCSECPQASFWITFGSILVSFRCQFCVIFIFCNTCELRF